MAEAGCLQDCLVDRVGDNRGGGAVLRHRCRPADRANNHIGIARIALAGDRRDFPCQGQDRKRRVILCKRFGPVDALNVNVEAEAAGNPAEPFGVFHEDEAAHAGSKRHQADFSGDAGRITRRQDDRLNLVAMWCPGTHHPSRRSMTAVRRRR